MQGSRVEKESAFLKTSYFCSRPSIRASLMKCFPAWGSHFLPMTLCGRAGVQKDHFFLLNQAEGLSPAALPPLTRLLLSLLQVTPSRTIPSQSNRRQSQVKAGFLVSLTVLRVSPNPVHLGHGHLCHSCLCWVCDVSVTRGGISHHSCQGQ